MIISWAGTEIKKSKQRICRFSGSFGYLTPVCCLYIRHVEPCFACLAANPHLTDKKIQPPAFKPIWQIKKRAFDLHGWAMFQKLPKDLGLKWFMPLIGAQYSKSSSCFSCKIWALQYYICRRRCLWGKGVPFQIGKPHVREWKWGRIVIYPCLPFPFSSQIGRFSCFLAGKTVQPDAISIWRGLPCGNEAVPCARMLMIIPRDFEVRAIRHDSQHHERHALARRFQQISQPLFFGLRRNAA